MLSTRAPSTVLYPFAAFHISYYIFIPGTIYLIFTPGTIYQKQYLQQHSVHNLATRYLRMKVSFRWIWQELE